MFLVARKCEILITLKNKYQLTESFYIQRSTRLIVRYMDEKSVCLNIELLLCVNHANCIQETVPLCSHDHVCNALTDNTTSKSNSSIHHTLEIEINIKMKPPIIWLTSKTNFAFITLKKYVPSLCCTENLHPGLSASNTLHNASELEY